MNKPLTTLKRAMMLKSLPKRKLLKGLIYVTWLVHNTVVNNHKHVLEWWKLSNAVFENQKYI